LERAATITPSAAEFALVASSGGYDANELGRLFFTVVDTLSYYNQEAKFSEFAKYSSERLKEHAVSDPDSILLTKLGKQITGFCFSRKDDGLIWLNWIGVRQDCRRQGLASALLQTLDERAKKAGAHKIWCDCRTNNEASKLMLTRNGYNQICTIPNHWYGQDYILWQKLVG
jgi:ribosomal protein S18 acetylase RimI-like enzyme